MKFEHDERRWCFSRLVSAECKMVDGSVIKCTRNVFERIPELHIVNTQPRSFLCVWVVCVRCAVSLCIVCAFVLK